MDHKTLVAIFKKVVANLSYRLQRILLQMQKYNNVFFYESQGPGFLSQIGYPRHKTIQIKMKNYQACTLPSKELSHAQTY